MNDRLWLILSMTSDWVRYSDGKAVALLGVQGILVGLSVTFFTNSHTFEFSDLNPSIFLLLGIIFILLSMIFTFLCLSPRLKNAGKISPIYFGSIAREFRNSGEYYKYIQNNFTSEDEVAQSVAEQIHANSVISSKKYALVSWSIRFLMVGLAFWVIYFILRLI